MLHSEFRESNSESLFIYIHGGGYTLETWYPAIAELTIDVQHLLVDLRGHGRSFDDDNFSLENMALDVLDTFNAVVISKPKYVIVIGHSLGSSIAIHLAAKKMLSNIIGVVDVDVVEGTAMGALKYMKQVIQQRPEQFSSLEDAKSWAISTNYMTADSSENLLSHQLIKNGEYYIWRTNLLKTEPFWEGWFTGLSDKFLGCRCGKLLVLASTNRLDTPLTIAQMQGKFQMEILPHGHALHEDSPKEFAEILTTFYQRQLPLKLPPKIK